jgi:hypothetical protein
MMPLVQIFRKSPINDAVDIIVAVETALRCGSIREAELN